MSVNKYFVGHEMCAEWLQIRMSPNERYSMQWIIVQSVNLLRGASLCGPSVANQAVGYPVGGCQNNSYMCQLFPSPLFGLIQCYCLMWVRATVCSAAGTPWPVAKTSVSLHRKEIKWHLNSKALCKQCAVCLVLCWLKELRQRGRSLK